MPKIVDREAKEKEIVSNQISCNGIYIHILKLFSQFLSFKHTLLIGTAIRRIVRYINGYLSRGFEVCNIWQTTIKTTQYEYQKF